MTQLAFFDVDGTLSAPYFRQPDGTLNIGLTEQGWLDYCASEKEDAYQYCEPVIPVRAYARKLKGEGASLFVLSKINSEDEIAAKEKFVELHYEGLFESVLTVRDDKDKIEVIRRLAKERGVELSDCELVEDTFMNLLYAYWNGIKGTHVAHLITEKALIYEGLLGHDGVAVETDRTTALSEEKQRPRNFRELHPNPALPEVYPYEEKDALHITKRINALIKERSASGLQDAVVIAIDGRCGSGKTSIAALLGRMYDCEVLHTDDFYLPFAERAENWKEIPAGNMDLKAIREAVERRKCVRGTGTLTHPVIILEGSYAHHPDLRDLYDLTVFLTCDRSTQEARLKPREGENYASFKEIWIPMEERYFVAFSAQDAADIEVDTTSIHKGGLTCCSSETEG